MDARKKRDNQSRNTQNPSPAQETENGSDDAPAPAPEIDWEQEYKALEARTQTRIMGIQADLTEKAKAMMQEKKIETRKQMEKPGKN